ncbi:putative Zn-binding protein involved in type VI secretion [Oxalobacteraceae bacterium GrIS 2.11]
MGDTLMGKAYIVVGDATSHGGKVLTGSPRLIMRGKAAARVGDKVSCPIHGDNNISEGQPNSVVDGVALVLDGHKTECGSVLSGSVPATHGS